MPFFNVSKCIKSKCSLWLFSFFPHLWHWHYNVGETEGRKPSTGRYISLSNDCYTAFL